MPSSFERHRRLTGLQTFLAWIGLGGVAVLLAVVAVVRVTQFVVDRHVEDLLWGLLSAALAVGLYIWFRREVPNLRLRGKALLPLAAVSLALSVGTSDTTLAACSTPGTHWHWRSSTDKFESKKTWTNCSENRVTHRGICTSTYKIYNYAYVCSPDIGYSCYWKYTGSVSNHHTHQCIYYV